MMKPFRTGLLIVFTLVTLSINYAGVQGASAQLFHLAPSAFFENANANKAEPNFVAKLPRVLGPANSTREYLLPPQAKQSWSAWIVSLPSKLAQRLRTAAGSGRRDVIIPRTQLPEQLAIWTAPMPPAGQLVSNNQLNLSIKAAFTPAWSANGALLACSKWAGRWVIAVYATRPSGEFSEQWKWVSTEQGTDFSPMWSPDEEQIAFIRQDASGKSDIWILRLGDSAASRSEKRLTNFGNVRQLLGWDAQEGILYESETVNDTKKVSSFWSLRTTDLDQTSPPKEVNLTIAPAAVRGRTPARSSSVYAIEFAGRSSDEPSARIFEFDSDGHMKPLLRSVPQFDRWPDVTSDGKVLAFTSNRPQGK